MAPSPLVRPFPIRANFTLGGNALVTFSENVRPGLLDPANWFMRWMNQGYFVTYVDSVGLPASPVVRLRKGTWQPSVGPNMVRYTPPPFDVRSFATGNHALRIPFFPMFP